MKIQKRILAFLTAALLLLPLTGCLVPKETDKTADSSAFDGDAIAIELGDIKITAQEFSDTFDQYVSYFSYGYGTDKDTLEQFMGMTEEYLVEYYMPDWKANTLGLKLSAEQEAECAANAQATVDEERDMLLCYYGDPEGTVADVSELSDEQRESAIEAINEELPMYFGEGYTFDDYLSTRYESALKDARISELSALLEEHFAAENPVDKAAIDEWYEKTLAEQKETFTEDPSTYLEYRNGVALVDDPICLYAPKEAAQIEVIYIPADDSDAETLDETRSAMEKLEAEYGALALRGENEARQAEIVTEYAKLKETYDTLEKQRSVDAKKTADKAYADLSGGMSFADAMEQYNVHYDEDGGRFEQVVYLDGSEPEYPAYAEIASKLTVGAYSEPTLVDGDYCIVRLSEILPEGVIDRASIEDDLVETAEQAIRKDAWQTQQDAWNEEAKTAAVYHREAYETLIDLYLS
ncbi:MAG: peptidyl-prolyl cis-trans isomerase [Clostridia bacterium]|nr:peptidyl-prolyl cis-trans isomerase [Clostridia bacterium]